IVIAAIAALAVAGVITAARLADITVVVAALAAVAYFAVILTSRPITTTERRRVYAFIPMFLASVVFWSLFQQIFTVLTIYPGRRLDRRIFGWEFPVSWVQSIQPVWVIIGAGAFAALWTRLGPRPPGSPVKVALGTAGLGGAVL